ncbi:MAG: hypothetical protein NUV64_03155 [Parcubacteria group bacterium]|nr:hypothetical protein [Parcubacteria group bacterium]MCR4342406.1 hypothetical protein [Patescibacteria group bacterium]
MEYNLEKYEYVQVSYFNFFKKDGNKIPDSDLNTLGFDGWELVNYKENIMSGTSLELRRSKNINERRLYIFKDMNYLKTPVINTSLSTEAEDYVSECISERGRWDKIQNSRFYTRELLISELYSALGDYLKIQKESDMIDNEEYKKSIKLNKDKQKQFENLHTAGQFNIFVNHLIYLSNEVLRLP